MARTYILMVERNTVHSLKVVGNILAFENAKGRNKNRGSIH